MNLEPCRICVLPTAFYRDDRGVLCSTCGTGGLAGPEEKSTEHTLIVPVSDFLDAMKGRW